MTEFEATPESEVLMVVRESELGGYGNPNATISTKNFDEKIENGELPPNIVERYLELITSKECMVEVHHHDDGCMDGRCTTAVTYFVEGEKHTVEVDPESLDQPNLPIDLDKILYERAKLAGGGYTTAAVMLIGAGDFRENADTQFVYAAQLLKNQGIFSGAHRAHETDQDTGCKAIDALRPVIENILVQLDAVYTSVSKSSEKLGYEFKPEKFNTMVIHLKDVLQKEDFFDGSTGQTRLKAIEDYLARAQQEKGGDEQVGVVKTLGFGHNEVANVFNFKHGNTFSQVKAMMKMKEEFPSVNFRELPQAFVVDFARIEKDAAALAKETCHDFDTLLYSGLAYQFGAISAITDGTQKSFDVEDETSL